MRRTLAMGALLLAFAAPAMASRDVRIVLDLSESMRTNDRGRLAILSTILLHDLVKPNSSTGDSFVVIPFDRDWRWDDRTTAPPVSTRPRIESQFGKRDEFVRAVQALPYDAQRTYFYPGLAAALQDLESKPAAPDDVRAIVLITDGVPIGKRPDIELQRIRDELGSRLAQRGIRFYVLAFGTEAVRNRTYFADMVQAPGGGSLGDIFVDPDGSRLLSSMLQIFSRSFGFSGDTPHSLPGTTSVDLEANTQPERVAVVVMTSGAQTPSLRLTTPVQHSVVSMPEGTQTASASGGSYALVWVLAPDVGAYGLDSTASPGTVAVLRPIHVTLEILPSLQHKQADRVLAGTRVPLRVLVRSAIGKGDPGPVALSFRTCGELLGQAAGAPPSYRWQSEPSGPAAGAFTVTPEGRVYDIIAEFQPHPETPGETYIGYLEVKAHSEEALVGAHTHRVEVHPLLAISPLPLVVRLSDRALGRRERACTQFTFHLDAGQLPHPDKPSYPIRATLIASDPKVLGRELNQTSFTLDGLPLQFAGSPGSDPGAWYKGRPVGGAELLKTEHKLCTRIGKPIGGDPAKPIALTLATTLGEDPYDDFGVIRSLDLKLPLAPPTFVQRWLFALVSGLSLFGLLALIWFLRDRPMLPRDLRYAVGREDSSVALAPRELGEPSLWTRLLGRIAERTVVAPGEKRRLGRICPVDAELFQLRPARNVSVQELEGGKTIARQRGRCTLAVHRTYRLSTDRASYLFRMEYQ